MGFILEKNINSCKVTKELLIQLENYIISQTSEIIGHEHADFIKQQLSIRIKDDLGIEQLRGINEYSAPIFPDKTESIRLELSIIYHPNITKTLNVSINFNTNRILATINIGCGAPNAREITIGFYEGIKRIIEPYRTSNWIFNPTSFVEGLIIGSIIPAAVALLWLARKYPQFIKESPELYIVWIFLLLGLLTILPIGKLLKPYIAFESRKSQRIERYWNWFVYGLIGFILFGTILGLIRRKIIGF